MLAGDRIDGQDKGSGQRGCNRRAGIVVGRARQDRAVELNSAVQAGALDGDSFSLTRPHSPLVLPGHWYPRPRYLENALPPQEVQRATALA